MALTLRQCHSTPSDLIRPRPPANTYHGICDDTNTYSRGIPMRRCDSPAGLVAQMSEGVAMASQLRHPLLHFCHHASPQPMPQQVLLNLVHQQYIYIYIAYRGSKKHSVKWVPQLQTHITSGWGRRPSTCEYKIYRG